MSHIEYVVSVIEYTLNTRRKRHIASGILMSVSLMFAGLAITVITIKKEDNDNEK